MEKGLGREGGQNGASSSDIAQKVISKLGFPVQSLTYYPRYTIYRYSNFFKTIGLFIYFSVLTEIFCFDGNFLF